MTILQKNTRPSCKTTRMTRGQMKCWKGIESKIVGKKEGRRKKMEDDKKSIKEVILEKYPYLEIQQK